MLNKCQYFDWTPLEFLIVSMYCIFWLNSPWIFNHLHVWLSYLEINNCHYSLLSFTKLTYYVYTSFLPYAFIHFPKHFWNYSEIGVYVISSMKLTTAVYRQALIFILLYRYNHSKTSGPNECDGYQYVLYVDKSSKVVFFLS